MKHIPFISLSLMLLLIGFSSCMLPRESVYYEDEPEVRSRPFYRTPYGARTIIVERDPFTGQLFEVSPFETFITPGIPFDPRFQGRGFRGGFPGPNVPINRGGNIRQPHRNGPVAPQQSEAQRQDQERQKEEARERVLGRKSQ